PLTLHVAKPISGDAATADSENVPSWKKLFDPNCWKSKRKQEQKPEDRKHFLFSLLRRSEEQPSDQMLTSRCRGLLFTDEELSSSAVSVQAQNGVIILQGTVSSAELKERAGRMAGQT